MHWRLFLTPHSPTLFEDVTVFEMLGMEMAIKSAENFRALRKKGEEPLLKRTVFSLMMKRILPP